MPPPAPGQRHPDRPRPNLVHLGQVADCGAVMLTLACRRCERSGRMRVARLLAEWGRFAPLADIMDEAAADCPRWREWSPSPYDHCGAHWPELPALLRTAITKTDASLPGCFSVT